MAGKSTHDYRVNGESILGRIVATWSNKIAHHRNDLTQTTVETAIRENETRSKLAMEKIGSGSLDIGSDCVEAINGLNNSLVSKQSNDFLYDNSINPLVKTIKPSTAYLAYTYGGYGDLGYSNVWLIMHNGIVVRLYGNAADVSLSVSGQTVTISSHTTLIMGIVALN